MLTVDAKNRDDLIQLFHVAVAEHRWHDALDIVCGFVATDPGNAALHYNKGVVLNRMGRHGAAIASYREAIRGVSPAVFDIPDSSAAPVRQFASDVFINLSFAQTDLGLFEDAVRSIERAALLCDNQLDTAPYIKRIHFIAKRRADPAAARDTAEMNAAIDAMNDELERAPLYASSSFWEHVGRIHVEMLRLYGFENFKRTVAHNYQNWLITDTRDPQFCSMISNWPRHNSRQPLINDIEAPSHVGFHTEVAGGGITRPGYVLAGREPREVYRLTVGLIWEYVLATDRLGVLENLFELEVGNPIRITRQGRLISSDIAHSVRERNLLMETCGLEANAGLCVAEIGGGGGRLAEIFGRTTNYRYFIFDIAPALYVSQRYVKTIFPDEKVFTFRPFTSFSEIEEELAGCRFAFFTGNQIEHMPDGMFDLFINMNSLMEMRMEQVINYLGHIDRLTKLAFLSRQWIKWSNEWDAVTLGRENFSLGTNWEKVVDLVDEIHPHFFNHVWKKKG